MIRGRSRGSGRTKIGGLILLAAILLAVVGMGGTAHAQRPDVLWLKGPQRMLNRDWPTHSVAFSPDGRLFSMSGINGTEVRRTSDLSLLFLLPISSTRDGARLSVRFLPDQGVIVTHVFHSRHHFNVWSMEDGRHLKSFDISSNHRLSFSPDGRYAFDPDNFQETQSATLRVWSLPEARILYSSENVRWWNPSPETGQLTLLLADGRVQVLNTADGSLLSERAAPFDAASLFQDASVALSPDGEHLLIQKRTHVELRRFGDGSLVQTFTGTGASRAEFTPDGRQIFIYRNQTTGRPQDDLIELYDISAGSVIQTFPGFNQALFSPDHSLLITHGDHSRLALWRRSGEGWVRAYPDITSDPSLRFGAGGSPPVSPDGSLLAVSGSAGEPVRVYRVSDEQVVREFPSGIPLAFSPDGETLAIALPPDPELSHMEIYPITLWRIRDGSQVVDPDPFRGASSLAFSPDGRLLAVGGEEIRIRSAREGTLLRSWPSGGGPERLTFSADGQTLRGETADKVREWRVADGTLLAERDRLPGLIAPDGLTSVDFHPTIFPHTPLRVWRAGISDPVQTLAAEGVQLQPIAFTPDSRALVVSALGRTDAAGNPLRTFELWSVGEGRLLRTLASVPLRPDLEVGGVHSDGRILAYVTVEDLSTVDVRDVRFTLSSVRVADGTPLHRATSHTTSTDANPFRLIDPGHDIYLTYHSDSGLIRLWRLSTGELLQSFGVTELGWNMTPEFTPDRRTLILKTYRHVSFWDVESGRLIREYDAEVLSVGPIHFSPAGDLIAYVEAGSVLVVAENPLTPLPGDVNNDRQVDVRDATMTLRFIIQAAEPTARERRAADMNRDSLVNVGDVVLILRKAIGLPD